MKSISSNLVHSSSCEFFHFKVLIFFKFRGLVSTSEEDYSVWSSIFTLIWLTCTLLRLYAKRLYAKDYMRKIICERLYAKDYMRKIICERLYAKDYMRKRLKSETLRRLNFL